MSDFYGTAPEGQRIEYHEPAVTPVEERIDHETELRKKLEIARRLAAQKNLASGAVYYAIIAATEALDALLTEHSAYREALKAARRGEPGWSFRVDEALALTTPESPPEQDREQPCEHGIAWGEFCSRCPGGGV